MRSKKLLSAILAFCMVLSTMGVAVFAEPETTLGEANFNANEGVVFDGTNYYDTLANAVKAVHGIEDAVLYCKPDADLGTMTHGHVCKNLTVYGNGAYLSGGEQDFEIDFPAASGIGCSGLTGDVTLTVDNLTGAGAWGSRTSEYDVNFVFTNCESMGKVFYMGTTGEVNITMTDCTFTSNDVSNCKVYSQAAGAITLTNVDFSNIEQPVALGNESTGTQTIVLTDCDFVNCGASTQDYTVPVSVKSKTAEGSSVLTVNNCTFTGTIANSIGQDADILFDYGAGKTAATIVNTTAKVGVETAPNEADYATLTTEDVALMTNKNADVKNPVAESNGKYYASVQAAVDAAVAGDNVIQLLPGTIDEDVFIIQQKGINITIKGQEGVVYTGTFEICGNNRSYTCENGNPAAETLTFDGIDFRCENVTDSFDFIGSNRKNTVPPNGTLVWGYPHNVTVQNCTFVGNFSEGDEYNAPYNVVALRNVGGYNWTIKNCTASNMHSFLQASANTLSSTIDNVTVSHCESALNLGTNANYTITNCNFDTIEFGIRADTNSDRNVDLNVTNNSIKSKKAFIFRKADSANFVYDVEINENKIISSETDIERVDGKDTDTISFNYGYNYWGGDAAVTSGINDAFVVDSFMYYIDEEKAQLGGAEAKVGETYYETLAKALEAAKTVSNPEITIFAGVYDGFTVPVELNNATFIGETDAEGNNLVTIKTMEDGVDTHNNGIFVQAETTTFKNLNITSGTVVNNWMSSAIGNTNGDTGMGSSLKNLTVENVNFTGSGVNQAIWTNQGNITLKNSTITNYVKGVDNYAIGADQKVVIQDSEITNVDNAFHTGEAAEGAKIVVTGTSIDSDKIDVGGAVALTIAGSEIKNATVTSYATSTIAIAESVLTDTAYAIDGTGTVSLAAVYANNLNELVDDAKTDGITFSTYYKTLEDMENKILSDFPLASDAVYVRFEDVTAEDAEGEMTYNINLVATDGEIINRLNSVDLTFLFDKIAGDVGYEIIESNNEVAINPVNNSTVRYEFHYEGKDGVITDTENTINIGQVRFEGYGKFNFTVDADATTNVVHATTVADNIVDTFVPNDDAATIVDGELVIDDQTITDIEIEVPTEDLTVKISFPNAISFNPDSYQNMTLTVEGEDLPNDYVIHLGSEDTFSIDGWVAPISEEEDDTLENDIEYYVKDGGYEIEFDDMLTKNTSYHITLEGAGYRTARYTVTMTEDKTVNFWNNVKDAAADVEAGKFQAKKNFLAGDIVKDNNINVYDLSAVVSYFGETGLSENNYPQYAKYDLNRDGFIDSKDVAMVLVSWNE